MFIRFPIFNTTADGHVKTLTNFQFILGFSKHQITQVLDNLHKMFSLSDVYNFVNIWGMKHALTNDISNDMRTDIHSSDHTLVEDDE